MTEKTEHRDTNPSDSRSGSSSNVDLEKQLNNETDRLDFTQPQQSDDGKGQSIDANIVTWDSEDDPANPLNWSRGRKWAATLIISAFAFIAPLSSSTVSPALPQIAEEFHIQTQVEQQLVLSIFLLGYSFGPLVLSPISETVGRVTVVQVANAFYIIFNLACGFARNSSELLAFRLLSGIGGSATLGIGSGVIRDVWRTTERGRGLSVYTLAPVLGPAIGPITGGFIAEYSTWRWSFWAVTIANVAVQALGFFFLQETYAPTILKRKAKRLRKETGNKALTTRHDQDSLPLFKRMHTTLIRPWRLLGTQPIIQCLALYQAYNYGLLYLFISSFPALWTDVYHESLGIGGLNYIAIALGSLLAAQICAPLNDKCYEYLRKRYQWDEGVPEFRIPLMLVGATITPIGLFWYGWAAETQSFWLLPDIGVGLYAFGSLICYQCIQVYVVDSYATYAASASAASTFLRSLAAFGFPLFAPYLFDGLGYGWGASLLGFVAIGLGIPAPFLFWRYGAALRRRSSFAME